MATRIYSSAGEGEGPVVFYDCVARLVSCDVACEVLKGQIDGDSCCSQNPVAPEGACPLDIRVLALGGSYRKVLWEGSGGCSHRHGRIPIRGAYIKGLGGGGREGL